LDEPLKDRDGADATTRTRIALVFTDVVGSSAAKRAAALGTDASIRDRAYLEGIQTKHLRLIRSTLAENNGKEIMTIGDSFFLAFEDPVDAVRCSAAIQQRLLAQPIDTPSGPLQLRIGIHIGTPEHFENSWHGIDVDIAARAQSAASPRQIIVTNDARKAMGNVFEIKFHPLGTFSLKGVGDVRLWDAGYGERKRRRASLVSKEQRRRRRVATSVLLILVAAALTVGAVWRWRRERQAAILASAAKQSIIVTEFENKTGDPIFDSTLTRGFTAQLEQSPVLKLIGEQHLRQSLQYLGKSSESPLTPEVIREIGIREGVKAYLAGSIAQLGDEYVVNVSAKDISTGDDIVSEEAQVRGKAHVLGALDKVATAMRRNLGESLSSIQKLDTPLGQATTASLEAFRAYALGDAEHEKGRDVPQAEAYYRQAVEIDPNFAMAWARLGIIAFNSGQQDQAQDSFTKAYHLSSKVSERERMYIAGHYYQNALGDLPKAIATLQLGIHTYPLDFTNYVNLGIAYGNSGQMEEYLSQFVKAAGVNPHAAVAQLDILGAQLTLDRIADARRTMANIKRLGFDDGTTYFLRDVLIFDFLSGDRAGMRQTLARAEGRVDTFQMTSLLALMQQFEGRYREAQASWQQARAQAAPLKANDVESSLLMYGFANQAMLGRCEGTDRQVKTALALGKSQSILAQAAFAAALCNDRKSVLPILADLARKYPSDTFINQVTIPQSRATLALAAHHPAEAHQYLEGSRPVDLVCPGANLRGKAYRSLQDGVRAMEAFRAATLYRGAALAGLQCCQYFPEAQLGLARAYVLTGDRITAKKAYQEFFTTWKTADPDIPQLIAARKEFASLN
jgi:class 3 adenylate cyclase/tetratricopeptide (TPR) repeat protein